MQLNFSYEMPDFGELFRLFESTGWNSEYNLKMDELASAAQASSCTVSTYFEGSLVGFGRMVSDGVLHGMIYEMMVPPVHQGKGIGSEILRRLIHFAEKEGIREVQLFCAEGKEDFYRKHGFVRRPDSAPGMTYVQTQNPR